jgi:soluble lytic murein transglycosylase
MGNLKKRHICRCRRLAWIFASLLVFLAVFNPIDPLNQAKGHVIEETEETQPGWIHQLVRIYTAVKSQERDLDEASAWTIAEAILEESKRYSLDPMLVVAVIEVESRFQPSAVSPVGARGLMQILPFVASALASEVHLDSWNGVESLNDPVTNIKIGVFYLSQLIKQFRQMELALSAYNSGPTRIRKTLQENGTVPTKYVRKVLSAYHLYSQNGLKSP